MATLYEMLGEGTYTKLLSAVSDTKPERKQHKLTRPHPYHQCAAPLECPLHQGQERRQMQREADTRRAEAARLERQRRYSTISAIGKVRAADGLAVLADELGTEAVLNYAFRR